MDGGAEAGTYVFDAVPEQQEKPAAADGIREVLVSNVI
jgi:hypothetical protein